MTYKKKERDTQRQRVYDSERLAALRMRDAGVCNKMIEDIADVERRVKDIVSSKFWKENYPKATIVMVNDGRGRRAACWKSNRRTIYMPKWSRSELIILHELAHAAHDGLIDHDWTEAAHGWRFCDIYLSLVSRFMGRAAHDLLAGCFRLKNVRFHKPRAKRVLTPEQKQVLRDRLAAIRASKVPTAPSMRSLSSLLRLWPVA